MRMHGPDAFPVYFAEVCHKLSANDEVAGKTHCILVFYLGVNVLYLHVLGFFPPEVKLSWSLPLRIIVILL